MNDNCQDIMHITAISLVYGAKYKYREQMKIGLNIQKN